jgi:hypothetical protein
LVLKLISAELDNDESFWINPTFYEWDIGIDSIWYDEFGMGYQICPWIMCSNA